jgi:hypothetical protein
MENYKVGRKTIKNTKALEEKIKLLQHKTFKYYLFLWYLFDKENFITIHGIKSEVYADIVFVLKTMQNTN